MATTPSMRDEAVLKATGKDWKGWFGILDRAGAKRLTHREIVAILARDHGVGSWWQQMVTVEYERARGLRVKHETAQGFSISASKTMNVSLAKLYKAWATAAARKTWLDESDVTVRRATANKSIRMTWKDDTSVAVGFVAKGERKSQVALEHSKLKSAAAAARMKTYWKKQLAELQQTLEH